MCCPFRLAPSKLPQERAERVKPWPPRDRLQVEARPQGSCLECVVWVVGHMPLLPRVRGDRTPSGPTQVEDYGVYDTSAVDKDVTAVVNVTFGVA